MAINIATHKGKPTIRASGEDAQRLINLLSEFSEKQQVKTSVKGETIAHAAQAAYEAYCMHAAKNDESGLVYIMALHWSEMDSEGQALWCAVAERLLHVENPIGTTKTGGAG